MTSHERNEFVGTTPTTQTLVISSEARNLLLTKSWRTADSSSLQLLGMTRRRFEVGSRGSNPSFLKKKGCKPQLAPVEGSLFNVFEVVGEHNQACVKLRHDHDTGVKRRSFQCLPIEPIASASEVLQIRTARS